MRQAFQDTFLAQTAVIGEEVERFNEFVAQEYPYPQWLAVPGCTWLYLAAVLDLHSRQIVGGATAAAMPAALVCAALQMAIVPRSPAPGLIVHSDRYS